MNKNIAILAAIIILSIVAIFSFSGNVVTPYISFQDAMKRSGEFVQVIGRIDHTTPVEQNEKSLSFRMTDGSGTHLRISYEGIKPQNFDHSETAVLLGQYDRMSQTFKAEKLLIKCPSKYTGEK